MEVLRTKHGAKMLLPVDKLHHPWAAMADQYRNRGRVLREPSQKRRERSGQNSASVCRRERGSNAGTVFSGPAQHFAGVFQLLFRHAFSKQ